MFINLTERNIKERVSIGDNVGLVFIRDLFGCAKGHLKEVNIIEAIGVTVTLKGGGNPSALSFAVSCYGISRKRPSEVSLGGFSNLVIIELLK